MKIHENYLNTDDIESLCNVAKRVQRTDNLRTNFGTWSDSIVQYSSPVMIYDIPDEYTTNLRQYSELEDMTAFMLYFWSHGSYIPWHDDNHASVTGTIYLNDKWERDWGGYLCWDGGYLIPKYNTMAQQHEQPHCTTPVTRPLYQLVNNQQIIPVIRTTLQFFKLKEEK